MAYSIWYVQYIAQIDRSTDRQMVRRRSADEEDVVTTIVAFKNACGGEERTWYS